jgi:hypothetical protein
MPARPSPQVDLSKSNQMQTNVIGNAQSPQIPSFTIGKTSPSNRSSQPAPLQSQCNQPYPLNSLIFPVHLGNSDDYLMSGPPQVHLIDEYIPHTARYPAYPISSQDPFVTFPLKSPTHFQHVPQKSSGKSELNEIKVKNLFGVVWFWWCRVQFLRSCITTSFSGYLSYALYTYFPTELVPNYYILLIIIMACCDFIWFSLRLCSKSQIQCYLPLGAWLVKHLWQVDSLSNQPGIWGFPTGKDLIIDTIPIVLNKLLRIYLFRLVEIGSSSYLPLVINLNSNQVALLNQINWPILRCLSFTLLCLSIVSLILLFAVHCFFTCYPILFSLKSISNRIKLTFFVCFKGSLFILDNSVISLILYQLLVLQGPILFEIANWETPSIIFVNFLLPYANLISNILFYMWIRKSHILENQFLPFQQELIGPCTKSQTHFTKHSLHQSLRLCSWKVICASLFSFLGMIILILTFGIMTTPSSSAFLSAYYFPSSRGPFPSFSKGYYWEGQKFIPNGNSIKIPSPPLLKSFDNKGMNVFGKSFQPLPVSKEGSGTIDELFTDPIRSDSSQSKGRIFLTPTPSLPVTHPAKLPPKNPTSAVSEKHIPPPSNDAIQDRTVQFVPEVFHSSNSESNSVDPLLMQDLPPDTRNDLDHLQYVAVQQLSDLDPEFATEFISFRVDSLAIMVAATATFSTLPGAMIVCSILLSFCLKYFWKLCILGQHQIKTLNSTRSTSASSSPSSSIPAESTEKFPV